MHDKFDNPILSLKYNEDILKFTVFSQDHFLEEEINTDVGFMLLNVIGYIREEGLECEPVAMRTMKNIVPPSSINQTASKDDWSL